MLNPKVAELVNKIEKIFDRQFIMEEAEGDDVERVGGIFRRMLQEIHKQFKQTRELRN